MTSDQVAGEALSELSFDAVEKYYVTRDRTIPAIRPSSFEVAQGEFVSIIGPSGCGKSTLLNMAAGFVEPTFGTVTFRGGELPKPNTNAGYMTQNDTLLGWRTVTGNVELPLELNGVSREERRERALAVTNLVGLSGFEEAYPDQLSGGMRKRVMLARTLVYEPALILADEPFGALDAQLRLVLTQELLELWRQRRQTILFVTHDVSEAITVSDRIIVMTGQPGEIVEEFVVPIERPRDVFRIRAMPGFAESFDFLWHYISMAIEGK